MDEATDLASLAKRLAADLAGGGKAEFAMDLLESEEINSMAAPAYIDQGLLWLADQLRRKKEAIVGRPLSPQVGQMPAASEAKA